MRAIFLLIAFVALSILVWVGVTALVSGCI